MGNFTGPHGGGCLLWLVAVPVAALTVGFMTYFVVTLIEFVTHWYGCC